MKKVLSKVLIVCAVLGLSFVALPASPAAASSCIYPVFRVYPGSVPSNIRYGEVDFQVTVCSTQSADQFTANVTGQFVNATGKNLGFFIDSVGVTTDYVGSYTHYWTGTIYASTCTPRIGWPCSRSYSFTVELVGALNNYTTPAAWTGTMTAPIGMGLFTTP